MKNSENLTRKKFNFLKKYYDETWDAKRHTLHVGYFGLGAKTLAESYNHATKYLIDRANEYKPITKKSRLLDVGCGAGRTLVDACNKYSCSGVGVDISDAQIADANQYLAEVNNKRRAKNREVLRVKFIRVSGSGLNSKVLSDEQFTHVISQDAILMVQDKESLFKNIFRVLAPGGVVAIADFLSETAQEKVSPKNKQAVYKFVNWNSSLSYASYQEALSSTGHIMLKAENLDGDMVKTYRMLADELNAYSKSNDNTYSDLQHRYKSIVTSVKKGQMGWGMFFAMKPERRRAIIAGTKKKSIGRYVANELRKQGWEVWLYSRHAKILDKTLWHERRADIASEQDVCRLLKEIPRLDLALMLADTNTHDDLLNLSSVGIMEKMKAKLVGSMVFMKEIARRYGALEKPVKAVWCAGKTQNKSKDLILYSVVNSGLAALVNELNVHYSEFVQAYYLPTSLVSPSTRGDEYIRKLGPAAKKIAEHPSKVCARILRIVNEEATGRIMDNETDKLL